MRTAYALSTYTIENIIKSLMLNVLTLTKIRAECTRRCADKCCSGNIRWSSTETRTYRCSLWKRRVTSSTGCSRGRPLVSPNSCSPRTQCAAVSRAEDRPSPETHGHLRNNNKRNNYYHNHCIPTSL